MGSDMKCGQCGNSDPNKFITERSPNGKRKCTICQTEWHVGGAIPGPSSPDWHHNVTIQPKTYVNGSPTDYWVRYTGDGGIYRWLHPDTGQTKAHWVEEPHQINMPLFKSYFEAENALRTAPTPPGHIDKAEAKGALGTLLGYPVFDDPNLSNSPPIDITFANPWDSAIQVGRIEPSSINLGPVRIDFKDGKVTFADGYKPDQAAAEFWKFVQQLNPMAKENPHIPEGYAKSLRFSGEDLDLGPISINILTGKLTMRDGYHPDKAAITFWSHVLNRRPREDGFAVKGLFAELWEEHAAWSQKTFGSDGDRGPVGPLKHLLKEVKEVMENTQDEEEYADCLLLLMDSYRRAFHGKRGPEALLFAARAKLDKNKARKWEPVFPDMPVEHIRAGEHPPERRPRVNPDDISEMPQPAKGGQGHLVSTRPDGLPRRNDISMNTSAELSIRTAVKLVEAVGAHPTLTEVIIMLDEAREVLADYLEGRENPRNMQRRLDEATKPLHVKIEQLESQLRNQPPGLPKGFSYVAHCLTVGPVSLDVMSGTVTLAKGYEPEGAAVALWDAVKKYGPRVAKSPHTEMPIAYMIWPDGDSWFAGKGDYVNPQESVVSAGELPDEALTGLLMRLGEPNVSQRPSWSPKPEAPLIFDNRTKPETYEEALDRIIGTLPPAAHPDERNPRGATWLDERANWEKEVHSLRSYVTRCERETKSANETAMDCKRDFEAKAKELEAAEQHFKILKVASDKAMKEVEELKAWQKVAIDANQALDSMLRTIFPNLPQQYGMPVDGLRMALRAIGIIDNDPNDPVVFVIAFKRSDITRYVSAGRPCKKDSDGQVTMEVSFDAARFMGEFIKHFLEGVGSPGATGAGRDVKTDFRFCFGCTHALPSEPFPGAPAGHRPCGFCIRNPKVAQAMVNGISPKDGDKWANAVGFPPGYRPHWYNFITPAKLPMDCYHSEDMRQQVVRWEEQYPKPEPIPLTVVKDQNQPNLPLHGEKGI